MKDQSSDQFPSQQQQKNVDKRNKEKGLWRWVPSGSRRINVQMGNFVWCQTDNHVRILAVIQECSAPDVVASRALGCAKMMVNDRLVPSRFEILDSLQTRVRKKCQEELPTLKMLICANRRSSFTLNLFSQKHQGDQIRASLRVNMTYSHMFRKIRIATCAKLQRLSEHSADVSLMPEMTVHFAATIFCRCHFCRPQHSD